MIEYLEGGDLAIFEGRKYRRDKKTGYYLNSQRLERLHRAVWEAIHGSIPKGFAIHHADGDKGNNEPDNLVLIEHSAHATHHGKQRDAICHDEIVRNLNENARPKAIEWHGSNAGRAWHSKHAVESALKMQPRRYVCRHCGTEFEKKPLGTPQFCSNACKSAYRRVAGLDDEERTCEACGNQFTANKFKRTRTCSRGCADVLRWNQKHQAGGNR